MAARRHAVGRVPSPSPRRRGSKRPVCRCPCRPASGRCRARTGASIATNDATTPPSETTRRLRCRYLPLAQLPHREHDERPHDVELLLDGEAPEMVEHRRLVERRPVPVGLADEVPVGHVGERPAARASDAVELGGRTEHPRTEGDDGDEDEHRRQQTPEPPPPERQQSDAAVVGVAQQQRRDEEARQGEEQVDAEEPALQMAGVEQEHGDDRGARADRRAPAGAAR